MSAEEVLTEVRKDHVFYEQSGGGVSFSGGESLDQIDFILECLNLCKSNRFHTAVDTSGDADFSRFESLFPLTDLFLYDIKCANEELHKKGTGISNTRILENLSKMLKTHPEKVWIRVPVIPGFNADEKEMCNIRKFLSVLPAPASIELLPYHGLGESKNAALGLEGFTTKVPSDEEMEKFKKIVALYPQDSSGVYPRVL
jgi:pyruvate formate lyase activating enzyme